jgi:AbiV family abortive infection protein
MHGKAKKHPRRYSTVMRLERHIHSNAARLFVDACTLYRAGGYASAYAVAILAYEELGKLPLVDHIAFEAVLDKGSYLMDSEKMDHLFSRKTFYSHINKQGWGLGLYYRKKDTKKSRVEMLIHSDKLEIHKQDAFYVGFNNGRIASPQRFRATHAYRQLKYTLGAFYGTGDLPFYGVWEGPLAGMRKAY